TPGPAPWLAPTRLTDAHTEYHADGAPLRLASVTGDALVRPLGQSIAVCTAGEFEIVGQQSAVTVRRGAAVFVSIDEGPLVVTGSGSLFVASAAASSR